jgi:hypothetical protein
MRKVLWILILISGIYADKGSIPFNANITIFEPNQRAVIAWNEKEEILILTTDLHASDSTNVLEVIPLPSEPLVKKGDIEVFTRANKLINLKLQEVLKGRSEAIESAGEITFHEKIGAHDISVTRVLNKEKFIKWVQDYLKSAGVENPKIPEPMKEVIGEYLNENFTWFVFDVISLNKEIKTNEPIQYRFKTDFLYYPLKITKVENGSTSIDLIILTPKLLSNFIGIPISQVNLLHQPLSITADELNFISKDIDSLLGHQNNMKLRIWRIQGELSAFDNDLIVR